MQTDLNRKRSIPNAVLEMARGDSADLTPAINTDVAFYKIQRFITSTQSKIAELTFTCSLSETYILPGQHGNIDNI